MIRFVILEVQRRINLLKRVFLVSASLFHKISLRKVRACLQMASVDQIIREVISILSMILIMESMSTRNLAKITWVAQRI